FIGFLDKEGGRTSVQANLVVHNSLFRYHKRFPPYSCLDWGSTIPRFPRKYFAFLAYQIWQVTSTAFCTNRSGPFGEKYDSPVPWLFHSHHGDAVLSFTICTRAGRFHISAVLEVLPHCLAQSPGALAVDDGHRLQLAHEGVIQEHVHSGQGLVHHHAPQVQLRLGGSGPEGTGDGGFAGLVLL